MKGLHALRPILDLFFHAKPVALVLGIVIATITVISGIGLLGLSGWFITATAIAGLSVATAIGFDVFAPAAGIRLLAIMRTVSRYFERLVTHDATLAVLATLREKLFRQWARPSAAKVLLLRPARLLFRLTADIDALDSLYLRVFVPMGAALATALFAGIALGLMQSLFGFAVVIVLLTAGLGLPLLAAKKSGRAMRRRAKGTEAMRARTIDLVAGQTELLMAGRLDAQCAALSRADHYVAAADRDLNRIEIRTGAGLGIVHAALLAGSLIVVGWLMRDGSINAPVAALAVLIVLGAMEPFSALRRGAMELGRTILAARRVLPRQEKDVELRSLPVPPAGKAVLLESVSAHYEEDEKAALNAVSLAIAEGEHVAIVGRSGSGKSTLFKVLMGEVAARGKRVEALPARLLTQRTELFQDTLRGNLLLAKPDADDAELMAALADAGLGAFVASLADGLNTQLGEGGLGLSGGQARRLALARLFLTDAPLWLLDEPTEGLDGETARDVLARLKQRAEGRTLLIATHLRQDAMICERILRIEQGAFTESYTRNQKGDDLCFAGLK
ncbi:thiol reductant ABC exporter subunit CydC [Daeguia caeni]|uniref:Thiol reductant ABC exporter subunit CydC n=1 Tax=Daeguia caeni TaxID=439612 RepID=A0ABV9H5Z1_9HYPH